MKPKVLFSFVLILLITQSCKKDSETIFSKDFIEINGDKRRIESKSNIRLFIDHNKYTNEFDYQFEDKHYSKEIAGYSNDAINFRFLITEGNLSTNFTGNPSKDSYPLVKLNNHQLTDYARITIILSKNGQDQYYFNSYYPTGNLTITEVKGKTIFEFSNIELQSGDSTLVTASGRFEL